MFSIFPDFSAETLHPENNFKQIKKNTPSRETVEKYPVSGTSTHHNASRQQLYYRVSSQDLIVLVDLGICRFDRAADNDTAREK